MNVAPGTVGRQLLCHLNKVETYAAESHFPDVGHPTMWVFLGHSVMAAKSAAHSDSNLKTKNNEVDTLNSFQCVNIDVCVKVDAQL